MTIYKLREAPNFGVDNKDYLVSEYQLSSLISDIDVVPLLTDGYVFDYANDSARYIIYDVMDLYPTNNFTAGAKEKMLGAIDNFRVISKLKIFLDDK